jgi:hypothetical protein
MIVSVAGLRDRHLHPTKGRNPKIR